MTSVALIAPGAPLKKFCTDRPYQMSLAGELRGCTITPYMAFYKGLPSASYAIMDNGAWEGYTLRNTTLSRLAREYRPRELVAPDAINNPEVTFTLVQEFLIATPELTHAPNIAVVAHGRSVREAANFIERIHELNEPRISTIMIGRAFSRQVGDPTARFSLANWIRLMFEDRYDVHLLGYNDDWGPSELLQCRSLVRSMDTVAPFTAALLGIAMDKAATSSLKPPRPTDYFNLQYTDFDLQLVEHNIEVLDEWAGAIDWRTNSQEDTVS
jgi:hypothetical protein